jgi:hypothetical protein
MKRFLRYNGLSLALASLFLIFWTAQAIAGFKVHNQESLEHGQAVVSFGTYLMSGHFWQATGENWESEFLQMASYVVLTGFLYQKGSAESKDPDEVEAIKPKPSEKQASWLYRNSLSLAFVALFFISFTIHAQGGLRAFNEERMEHGQQAVGMGDYISDAEFWFQSFQNWQSEFLAVLAIVLLSIFLRQQNSPESKAIDDPNWKTGS